MKPSATVPVQIADLKNHVNISNLNSPNWVYGNTTDSMYYLELFNQTAGKNVTKCPIDMPFVIKNTSECTVCPSETPHYDLEIQDCIKCAKGYVINTDTHQCEKKISSVFPDDTACTMGRYYNFEEKKCQCPS